MECDGDNDGEGGGGDGDNSPGTLRKFIEERDGRLVEERRRFGQPSSSKGNDHMLHNIWKVSGRMDVCGTGKTEKRQMDKQPK